MYNTISRREKVLQQRKKVLGLNHW
uniref:Uncharacterized protein n=1 Tax=Tetranychus urticae TaxID=32264 RepID=T1JWP6_TETUR